MAFQTRENSTAVNTQAREYGRWLYSLCLVSSLLFTSDVIRVFGGALKSHLLSFRAKVRNAHVMINKTDFDGSASSIVTR